MNFVTLLLLLYVFVFGPKLCEIFSSLTRDWTCTPRTGRQSLNHWTCREVPYIGQYLLHKYSQTYPNNCVSTYISTFFSKAKMWTISHPLGLSPDPNKDVWRINNNNLKTNKNPSWTPLNAAKNWGGHPALFSFWCLTFLSECFQSAYSWNLCNHEGPFASGSNHCLDIPCVKFSLSLFSFYILKQVLKSNEHKTNAVFILYNGFYTNH